MFSKLIKIKDLQFWALSLALLLLCAALFKPSIKTHAEIYNYIFVIDITQSMNTRDYAVAGLPADRLSFVKRAIQQALTQLPCHSKVGLGLFTAKNMFLLFEPLEICQHYAVIEHSLMKIDWRMAWAANSHIARGLYTSIRELSKLTSKPRLVFFTDGQQTPASVKEPPFILKRGLVPGIIMGAGNLQPAPVPKLDQNNNPAGYWKISEAESQRGYTAIPTPAPDSNYLSSLKENELKKLAGTTGLQYWHLESPKQFIKILQSRTLGQTQMINTDISWILVLLALLIISLPYFRYLNDDR